ncbi:hypothetical protein RHS01_00412 [Rhizoctonia solani]|uniref:Uncharacterized protein n=1 Tax=Rhizoctonia solani TaxID=456999 RepID=A0A8H7IJJ5_9AGAM|nr:hypothetical protein RHS01_00412 [Rhizoctonia solani]
MSKVAKIGSRSPISNAKAHPPKGGGLRWADAERTELTEACRGRFIILPEQYELERRTLSTTNRIQAIENRADLMPLVGGSTVGKEIYLDVYLYSLLIVSSDPSGDGGISDTDYLTLCTEADSTSISTTPRAHTDPSWQAQTLSF